LTVSASTLGLAFLLLIPFLCFFYFYCLYLIPVCFKGNKRKQFWLILSILLLTLPLLDALVQIAVQKAYPDLTPDIAAAKGNLLFHVYKSFITNFIGYTSMLYVMELLEEIRTSKEIAFNEHQLAATELHLVKTQINPDFMIRSLDGIIQLSQAKRAEAPEAVIHFSDVLRYRLYRSNKRWVPLQEELQQLERLFQFQNTVPGQESLATLEVEGTNDAGIIAPLTLINIAEPLMTTYLAGSDWSLLFYLLIEEHELQIAVELTAENDALVQTKFEAIKQDMLRLSGTALNFTQEKEQNNYSVRICLPLQTTLTA